MTCTDLSTARDGLLFCLLTIGLYTVDRQGCHPKELWFVCFLQCILTGVFYYYCLCVCVCINIFCNKLHCHFMVVR